jgi:hypothetical protein
VLLVAVMRFTVRFNVIGKHAESNASIPEIVRHLDAYTAVIPALVQQVNCIAFASNLLTPQLPTCIAVSYPPDV